jgi:hypothetical protein
MKPRVNWIQARVDYVNDSKLSLREIASRYGVSESAVHSRSAREGWSAARTRKAHTLVSQTTRRAIDVAADELSKWNESDLTLAKALRHQVGRKLQAVTKLQAADATVTMESRDLRSLALAAESAQRIARLALGASTEISSGWTPIDPNVPDMESLSDDELTDVEQGAATLRRLLAKAGSNSRSDSTSPSGSTVQ